MIELSSSRAIKAILGAARAGAVKYVPALVAKGLESKKERAQALLNLQEHGLRATAPYEDITLKEAEKGYSEAVAEEREIERQREKLDRREKRSANRKSKAAKTAADKVQHQGKFASAPRSTSMGLTGVGEWYDERPRWYHRTRVGRESSNVIGGSAERGGLLYSDPAYAIQHSERIPKAPEAIEAAKARVPAINPSTGNRFLDLFNPVRGATYRGLEAEAHKAGSGSGLSRPVVDTGSQIGSIGHNVTLRPSSLTMGEILGEMITDNRTFRDLQDSIIREEKELLRETGLVKQSDARVASEWTPTKAGKRLARSYADPFVHAFGLAKAYARGDSAGLRRAAVNFKEAMKSAPGRFSAFDPLVGAQINHRAQDIQNLRQVRKEGLTGVPARDRLIELSGGSRRVKDRYVADVAGMGGVEIPTPQGRRAYMTKQLLDPKSLVRQATSSGLSAAFTIDDLEAIKSDLNERDLLGFGLHLGDAATNLLSLGIGEGIHLSSMAAGSDKDTTTRGAVSGLASLVGIHESEDTTTTAENIIGHLVDAGTAVFQSARDDSSKEAAAERLRQRAWSPPAPTAPREESKAYDPEDMSTWTDAQIEEYSRQIIASMQSAWGEEQPTETEYQAALIRAALEARH